MVRHEVNKLSVTFGPKDGVPIGHQPAKFTFTDVRTKDKTIVSFAIKAI
ncbi:hypothetical protein GCM10007385_42760 [Tateyamaria omphalii]|nr:hypothetical protein GCM10007385_42760 [Tateyamaria omphalii]